MPRFAANLTMLFNEVSFVDRFSAAARAGFAGVEYLFPYDYEPSLLRQALREHRLTQVLHNLPAGNWRAGERGIACHPDRTAEFSEGVEQGHPLRERPRVHSSQLPRGHRARQASTWARRAPRSSPTCGSPRRD